MKQKKNRTSGFGFFRFFKRMTGRRKQRFTHTLTAVLSWLVIFAMLVGYGLSAWPMAAQENSPQSTAQSEPGWPGSTESTPAENSIGFSMRSDPLMQLNTSPSRIGEILVSKNVQAQTGNTPSNSSFDISLSALSSWSDISSLLTRPLDIVLVLDTSGSMKADYGSGMTRMDAMKESISLFVDSLEKSNNAQEAGIPKSNLGIITYNTYAEPELPLTSDISAMRNCIDQLRFSGVTYSNLGLKEGLRMIEGSEQDGRGKVLIFFTDGQPSDGYGFTRSIADEAVQAAAQIRSAGAKIYTVGIFPGADPDEDVALKPGTENTNRFMQAVSSNYPQASLYSTDLGLKESSQYYLSADNPEKLETTFEYIFQIMDGGTGYPTKTDLNAPESSGYVHLHDEAGEWMEFTDPILHVQSQEYSPASSQVQGNTVTYTYSGEVPTNVPGKTTDLSCIKLTVTRGIDGAGDILDADIPAALLPLDAYSFQARAASQEREIYSKVVYAIPVSLTYQAMLDDSMKQALSGQKTTGSVQAAAWLDAQSGVQSSDARSSASFFSNLWKPSQESWASFVPASENQFYHSSDSDPVTLQTVMKTSNPTETLDHQTSLEREGNQPDSSWRLTLGNNGRLDLSFESAVRVSKTVISAGDYPAPQSKFQYQALLEDRNGQPYSGNVSIETADHQSSQLTFTDGKASFELSDADQILFKNLPLFSTMQIEEMPAAGFTSSVHTVNGTHVQPRSAGTSDEILIVPGTRTSIDYVNTYSLTPLVMSPDQSQLKGEKVLSGRAWQDDDSFTFEVVPLAPDDAYLPQKTSVTITGKDVNKTFDFGTIQFDHPGNYVYAMYEKTEQSQLPGVTNSLSVYVVEITVTDADNGTMQAAAPKIVQLRNDQGQNVENDVQSAVFTNTYNAAEVSYSPTVTKHILAGTAGSGIPQSGIIKPDEFTFSFTLKALDAGAPMPDGAQSDQIQTVNTGSLVQFAPITFDQSSIGKTWHYEISENSGSDIPGMSTSAQKILLDIQVSRAQVDGVETIVCTPQYYTEDHQPIQADQVALINRYVYTPASALIQARKTLEGRDMKDGEFSFNLSAANDETAKAIEEGGIILNSTASAGASKDGQPSSFDFGPIQFLKPGLYFFEVTESQQTVPGVVLDESHHYVQIEVTLNAQTAALQAQVKYLNAEDVEQNAVQFENIYTPVFDALSAVSVAAQKVVLSSADNQDIHEAVFRFLLTDPNGDQSVLNSPEGVFDVLKNQIFPSAGTYVYQLEEEMVVMSYPQESIHFDPAKYRIEIEVLDDGQGVLKAQTPQIYKDGAPVDRILFENSMTPTPVPAAALPYGEKQLSGKDLEDGEFSFVWSLDTDISDGVQVDGSMWNDEQTVRNSADGQIKFFGNDLLFVKPGHYEISLREETGEDQQVQYDSSILTWSYDVRAERGVLVVETSWPQSTVFNNTWKAAGEQSVSVTLNAKKELKNGTLKDGDFSFELLRDGKVIQTVSNKKDGSIVFDPLTYNQPGEDELIIREKAGSRSDIEYDSSQYTVKIQITEDKNGALQAQVNSEKDLLFTNTIKNAGQKPSSTPGTASAAHGFEWMLLLLAMSVILFSLRKRIR